MLAFIFNTYNLNHYFNLLNLLLISPSNSHFRIGDKYAEVVSEGIRGTPTYKNFEFSHNRLTPKGADNLLPRLVLCAETLDLSENNIGKLGCEHISRMLHHKKSK